MSAKRRLCSRCGKPIPAARLAQKKRTHYLCEKANKREQRITGHDRRIARNGFTAKDYWRLYEAQNGHCAILNCRANGTTKFLAVDHDHKCDKGHPSNEWCTACVRGLVCSMHNGWLGKAGDCAEVFDSLAAYLRNPPARAVLFPEVDYTEGGMW